MDLNALSKAQLVNVCKIVTGSGGDYARRSKDDYVNIVAQLDPAEVAAAVSQLGAKPSLRLITAGAFHAPQQAVSAPVRVVPDVRVIAKKTVKEVFGVKGKGSDMLVEVWNDPDAPKVKANFKWKLAKILSSVSAINRNRNVWLAGPAGTGKTEFVRQLCARLGRSFVRVSFDGGIEAYQLIGGERPRNGSMVWQDGIVLQAIRRPGAIVLLDEVSFARPEYASALHAVLEPEGTITVSETGEVITKAPGVVFFAADNTNGRGDTTGTYGGTREQNNAFLNRFGKFPTFDYLPPEEEAEIIVGETGCTPQLARLIADFLTVCRQKSDAAAIDAPPTMREAFYLAEALTDGLDHRLAFEECVVNRAPIDAQEVLQQLWVSNINSKALADAIAGVVPVDPASVEHDPPGTVAPY